MPKQLIRGTVYLMPTFPYFKIYEIVSRLKCSQNVYINFFCAENIWSETFCTSLFFIIVATLKFYFPFSNWKWTCNVCRRKWPTFDYLTLKNALYYCCSKFKYRIRKTHHISCVRCPPLITNHAAFSFMLIHKNIAKSDLQLCLVMYSDCYFN